MRNSLRRRWAVGLVVALAAQLAAPATASLSAAQPSTPSTSTRAAPTVGLLGRLDGRPQAGPELAGVDAPRMARPDAAADIGSGDAGRGPLAVVPAPPAFATASGAPALGTVSWAGITNSANPSPLEPADSSIGVGPSHVAQIVNRVIRITGRDGSGTEDVPLNDLFPFAEIGFPGIDGWGDGRISYDAAHGRWIVTMLAYDCNTTSSVGLLFAAVSEDANPGPAWDGFYLDYTDFGSDPGTADDIGYLPDYPAVGSATDKIVISANEFELVDTNNCTSGASYAGASLAVVDWAPLLWDLLHPIQSFPIGYQNYPSVFTWRPALATPATTSTVHVVGEVNVGASTSDVYYGRVTGTVAAGTVAFGSFANLTTAGTMSAFSDPPQPVDPGGAIGANVVDRRPTDAILRSGRLLVSSTYPCTPVGDGTGRSCARLTELSVTSTPALIQDVLFGAVGTYAFYSGAAKSADGSLFVAYSTSAAGAGIGTSARYQRATDAAGAFGAAVVVQDGGTTVYGGNRWGDYLGVAPDPLDPTAAWVGAPYAAAGGSWATRVAQLQAPGAVYAPVTPVRLLDTRLGTGLSGPFVSSTVRTFQVTGQGGIPADAVAVTGNLTVTGQTSGGYVTLGPTVTSSPPTSTINFPTGDNRANNVTIPLSTSGQLSAVFKGQSGRTVHLIFDVTGYFTSVGGATYHTVTPVRLLDSRFDNGLSGPFAANVPRTVQITGRGGIPAEAVAITGNLTVTGQTKGGYVSVTTTPTSSPATSTINFPVGDNRANGLAIPLGAGGTISAVYKASAATTHLILDVTGYFVNDSSGTRFVPLPPGRRLDTRLDVGLPGAMVSNQARTLAVRPFVGLAANAVGVTGNLTVTGQAGSGYVSMTEVATSSPETSTLNFPTGDNRANGVFAPLASDGSVGLVYKASSGKTTHLILDVTGYFR